MDGKNRKRPIDFIKPLSRNISVEFFQQINGKATDTLIRFITFNRPLWNITYFT